MSRNSKTITVDNPLPIKASMLKDVESIGKAMRAADGNVLIIRDASDFGFSADEVIVLKGRADAPNPDHVAQSTNVPVLSQKGFIQMLKYFNR